MGAELQKPDTEKLTLREVLSAAICVVAFIALLPLYLVVGIWMLVTGKRVHFPK